MNRSPDIPCANSELDVWILVTQDISKRNWRTGSDKARAVFELNESGGGIPESVEF
jgi:hypothetical protein